MGNETSKLKGLKIGEKALEETEFYTLKLGEVSHHEESKKEAPAFHPKQVFAIFQADVALATNFMVEKQPPLTRAIKNMKIYRHPNILRYVTSWHGGTNTFLATEQCRPLSSVLTSLSDIEVCIGLKSILGALIFLTEHANTRHLNVAISSIYVNTDGQWKLFGFEHLWKASECTPTVLEKSKSYRYEKAVDSGDADGGVEQFAFATLCEDVLKAREKVSNTLDFIEYCQTHLKHTDVAMRPSLQAVLLHPFFNHDFVQIHSYLVELPLKTPSSKQDFFATLAERLKMFDEETMGAQLGHLLVSRIVLLDPTAKRCFIPQLLRPRTDTQDGLFGRQTFTKHLIPRIKANFMELDAQIRIALLEHFPLYVELFSAEDLSQIMPQLQLGLKDTNDFLVSRTLFCMAELVHILGATAVVGADRTRLFSDGRPGPETTSKEEPRSITPVLNGSLLTADLDAVDISGSYDLKMPERLSPDGEEIPTASEVEVDEWSDWDGEPRETPAIKEVSPTEKSVDSPKLELKISEVKETKVSGDFLEELDIKSLKVSKIANPEEFDFFKDMEPVIQATSLQLVTEKALETDDKPSRLTVVAETVVNNGDHGWETDDNWGE